jgi:Na+-translocating ferredoxin:NAD+ oxidoreductase RnfE subunit
VLDADFESHTERGWMSDEVVRHALVGLCLILAYRSCCQNDLPRGHASLSVLIAVGDGIVAANIESNVCNCSF